MGRWLFDWVFRDAHNFGRQKYFCPDGGSSRVNKGRWREDRCADRPSGAEGMAVTVVPWGGDMGEPDVGYQLLEEDSEMSRVRF